jgi:hypothetical protein
MKLAAKRIVTSKAFDNSILCTNESTVLAFTNIADTFLAALKTEGAHICSSDETQKLRQLLFTDTGFNTAMIGKDASIIAKEAGFSAPNAKILVTRLICAAGRKAGARSSAGSCFRGVSNIDQRSSARSMMRHSAGPFRRHPFQESDKHHGFAVALLAFAWRSMPDARRRRWL